MRKLTLLLLGICLFCALQTWAQNSVTGQVTDANGLPIPGATIKIKNSKAGTTSAADGSFKLNVPANGVLVISGVGFQTVETTVSGSTVNISLKQSDQSLTEVVVTALGIKREKKALGYAVTTVDKKDLELRSEGDVGRVLNGKVAGLDVLNTSGISGSGTNISIRGISTITGGASTPLFIVDGVPFDGGNNASEGFQYGSGATTASRFLDLDPNNIESINVLKGLSAATLYGEAARNGVILVTTKNGGGGKLNKKREITVSQSIFANQVANLPDYQHHYGGGFDLAPSAAFSNWGAKFTDPPLQVNYSPSLQAAYPDLYAGKQQDYRDYGNQVRDFFRTGIVKTTSINIAGGNDKASFNGNYSYMDDQGFTPGNRVYKNNFGVGGTAKLSNKFTFNSVFNFSITDFQTPVVGAASGGGGPDVTSVFAYLLFTPRSINLMGLPYENPLTHESIYYRGGNDIENPRWTAANAKNTDKTFRSFGSVGLKYDVNKTLSINYRLGYDVYSEQTSLQVNKGGKNGGPQYVNGLYRSTSIFNTIFNHLLYATYMGRLSTNFSLEANGGLDWRQDKFNRDGLKSTYQTVYGLFNHGNFTSHDIYSESGGLIQYAQEKVRTGAYFHAALGYRDYLYLNVDGRNDWISTLEKSNRTLFYPGVSASFIPTTAIASLKGSRAVNYLKLRVGFSTSAHFPEPYNTRPSLAIATNAFVDAGGNVFNVGAIPNLLPNPNLKPELLEETEAGIEGKFFDNRISLDLTGYFRTSTDQILLRQLDPSTGYTAVQTNAGSVDNKGIEAALGVTVVRNKDWTWDLNGVFTLNRSKVHDIPDDIKQIVIAGFTNLGTFAMNGQPLGILQGNYRQVDSKTGKYIVDDNGYYLGSSDIGIIGDPNPKYKLTGISTLSYKNISFRMQWDYTHGGVAFSNTVRTLLARGLTKDTDVDRKLPYILPNTVKQDGTPNDYQQSFNNIYFNAVGFGPADITVWDATLVRLREISLSFSLPNKVLDKTPFGSVSLTLTGNNLFFLAPNFPKYMNYDPESNSLGVSNSKGLDFFAGPSARRYGGSIRITF
jgi:TonB-linked SusC/RagA family outer membrane protein